QESGLDCLEHDLNTDKITVDASLKDNYNNKLDKTYDVKFLRIVNENDFKAEFTDQDTGEKIIYDTNEVKASIAPVVAVLVGFIAKQGLKKAIQKYGKTVVTSMIRTSPQVAAQAAKKLGYSATKHVSHGKKVFKKNSKGRPQYISVDKDGHRGGAWKGASSIKNLGSKKTRSGTYDANLKRIGD
uniref:SAR2788 family putative toxin n=1 Tax=Staphylococcus aureus TaxID=1280 RepID=UPI001F08A261